MYDLLGTRFRVQAEDDTLIHSLDRLLAPFVVPGHPPVKPINTYALVQGDRLEDRGDRLLAFRDCKLIGRDTDTSAAIAALLTSLNRSAVEECEFFAAHAAVVSFDGAAVALPAKSGRGKSTLAASCLRAGFEYVSDEALCVEVDTGDLIKYPKPLGLSKWSRTLLNIDDSSLAFPERSSEAFVTADDLAAKTAHGALRLDHIVTTEYGHDRAELVEIAGSEAMRVLLEMSFNHYKFGAEAFQLAADLANQTHAWKLTYGDPLEAGKVLRAQLT